MERKIETDNVTAARWPLFMAFVRKEFLHIFRDHTSMLILLIMPVVMLVLFGYALNTEVRNSKLAILDMSHDQASQELTERLLLNNYFELTSYLNSYQDIDKEFLSGRVTMVIVFPPLFLESLQSQGYAQVQLLADASDPNVASTVTNYATSIINQYLSEMSLNSAQPVTIRPIVKLMYNPSLKAAYNFVPGVMGMIILLICAMMTSVSIAREKERGTMELLLVSPMKPVYVIISKAVPYFFISLVNLVTILLMAVFVMGVTISGSLFWLIIISLIYIFVCLAFGLLISSVVSTQLAAMVISAMGLMMPVMLLTGMMFPVENMPWFLRLISDFIPAKWYILATKKIMIKGLGLEAIVLELGILLVMAILLVSVSLKKFRTRLE